MKNNYSQHLMKQQSGMALVICLVLLLVITLITVTGLNSASDQQKMATNAQQKNVTFQNAEGAVSLAILIINGSAGTTDAAGDPVLAAIAGDTGSLGLAKTDGKPIKVKDTVLSLPSDNLTVFVEYQYLANYSLTPGISLNADENSMIIGENRYLLKGQATLDNTGAKSTVTQGISYE